MKKEVTGLMVRLPRDVKGFIAAQSEKNGSSQNSEIIRAVRERMENVQTKQEAQAAAGK